MWPVIRRPGAPHAAPHRRYAPDRTADGGVRDAPVWRTWSGLYPGEPEACRRDPRDFLPVLAHLGLLLAVFKVYSVETRAFRSLALLALLALPAHYLAPYRWKKAVFIAVSVAGLVWVLGPAALAVLAVSAVFIGLCYLPAAWGVRVGLVGAAALACGLARSADLGGDALAAVWPMLATVFMFRMIVYLYELKHARGREPLADTLSYFFLLPNFCFPLFPVVDYRTMQRGYFCEGVHATQRAGLRLIFQGTTHLLLFNLIYNKLCIREEQVRGLATLAQYVVTNYAKYLHVSGQFHVACGLLHLFGFKLPETHRRYFLATGFTDYWRRINIYWKDMMVRLVFNPVVFRLKRRPQPLALAAGTAAVFLATWLLHAYQKFWLQGVWGFAAPDALFWFALGLLVMVNVQLDARRPPRRAAVAACGAGPASAFALRAAKTAGTFLTIALLWSLWSSPSLGSWTAMLRRGLTGGE